MAEQQALALAAAEEFANEDVRHCAAHRAARSEVDPQRDERADPLQRGVAGVRGRGQRHRAALRRAGAGKKFHVYCDETRPRSQGATLTAWELAQQGISHQIIADNAAGHLMQRGEIDLVIVGSDRTLGRTGEVANKIGTYTKAVLARRHRIPFYVAIPLSTIDWTLGRGRDIPIEEREAERGAGPGARWRMARAAAGAGAAGLRARGQSGERRAESGI